MSVLPREFVYVGVPDICCICIYITYVYVICMSVLPREFVYMGVPDICGIYIYTLHVCICMYLYVCIYV